MTANGKPLTAITMGDPAGIGPEVTAKALMDGRIYERCRPFVIGSAAAMEGALRLVDSRASTRVAHSLEEVLAQPGSIDVLDLENLDYGEIVLGQVSATAGRASVEWVLKACEMAASGQVQAVVTAPINKEACGLAGYEDIGHMEIFQRQSGASEVATMLMTDGLRVVHLTTHRALRVACDYVTRANVLAKIMLTHRSFRDWGFSSPRIGVAALNPHASDGGLLGNEEAEQITPAVEEARALGVDATGPVPPDTVFAQAIDGRYDVVLAMYHDQGHIAIKVHNWAKSISVNLGLPFIRTSVDHGTRLRHSRPGRRGPPEHDRGDRGCRGPGQRGKAQVGQGNTGTMRISFIGGGVMAEALVGGVLEAKLATAKDIRIGEPVEARRTHLADRYGVEVQPRNLDVLDGADIAVLSIKPQNLSEVMAEVGPGLNSRHVVLSIVAGARMETLVSGLKHAAVIRVMPNTPAQIGAGMTVWTASAEVPQDKVAASRDILRTLGEELYAPNEKLIDMATALSASGPAYVFLFIEALIDAGVYLGMPRDMARKLVLQTVLGSAKLVQESGQHPAELKDMVSSPGGGTVEALMVFEQGGFRGVVLEAVASAYERYRELGKQS